MGFGKVGLFSSSNDLYLLGSLMMNSNVVAAPHLEKDVVTIGIFRSRDEVAFKDVSGPAGNSDEAANLGTCFLEMIKDFSMISFQFGRC